MTTIASWNINSVRSRLPYLLAWLKSASPDIVCLQEIKCVNEQFPALEIEELGYNLAISGEKSYNGVAILSKFPLEDIRRGLPGDDADTQARYIEAVAETPGSPIRIASIYVPNGQSPESEKFPYKLKFFERLAVHAKSLMAYEEKLVLAGDYNIAPAPADVFDPIKLDGTAGYHPEERKRFRAILNLGFCDAYRLIHPHTTETYTFWDYRAGALAANAGYRIDHLLLSPQAADCLIACDIHNHEREREKASDHAPVVVTLKD